MGRGMMLAVISVALLIAACGGDDNGGSSNGGGGDGQASQTPFIAPSPYTTEEALQKFDEVELAVKTPDRSQLQKYGISETDLQQRISLILQGTSDTTGLDDARAALKDGNRILAAEYIHSTVTDYVTPAFGPTTRTRLASSSLTKSIPGTRLSMITARECSQRQSSRVSRSS